MATKAAKKTIKAKPARAKPIRTVLVQDWEESERGFGVRPDGFTLHLTLEAHKAYVEAFWRRQKERLGESTPDEYTRTCGSPKPIDVNEMIYKKLVKHKDKDGLWGNGNHSPAHLLHATNDVNTPV